MSEDRDSEYRPAGRDAIIGWLVFVASLIAILVVGYRVGLPEWQIEIACFGVMAVFAIGSVIYDRLVRRLKMSAGELVLLTCTVVWMLYYLAGRAAWLVLT